MLDPVHHPNFLLLIPHYRSSALKPEDITATKGLRPNGSIQAVRNSRGEPATLPRPVSPSGACETLEELTAHQSRVLHLNSKIGLRRSTRSRETATTNGACLLVVGNDRVEVPRQVEVTRPGEVRAPHEALYASECKPWNSAASRSHPRLQG